MANVNFGTLFVNRKALVGAGIILGSLTLLFPNAAFAQVSNNIGGDWNGRANNTSVTLKITQKANHSLTGNMSGQCIQGFYIPLVRRFVFMRWAGANCSGVPSQFYEGTASQDGKALAGKFSVWTIGNGASNSGVDFNFSAERPPVIF
jgi:hypothetical protein